MLYVKDILNPIYVENNLHVKIQNRSMNINIGLAYRPIRLQVETKDMYQFLRKDSLNNHYLLLMGDFNIPDIDAKSPESIRLKEFIGENLMLQKVTEPTRCAIMFDFILKHNPSYFVKNLEDPGQETVI